VTRWGALVVAAVAFVVVFVALTKVESRSNASGPTASPFSKLVAELRDGVFRVETPCSVYEKSGTGFLIGPRLVATALHVVNGADTVTLSQDGQQIATGAVVGRDYANDLTLVETDRALPGHVFELSTTPAVPGEAVGALGFTGGQDTARDAQGIVIGRHRVIDLNGLERSNLVEVEMLLGMGDSGGPIFDLSDGRVVALVDAGPGEMSTVGLGIDAEIARPLIGAWAAAPQPLHGSSC